MPAHRPCHDPGARRPTHLGHNLVPHAPEHKLPRASKQAPNHAERPAIVGEALIGALRAWALLDDGDDPGHGPFPAPAPRNLQQPAGLKIEHAGARIPPCALQRRGSREARDIHGRAASRPHHRPNAVAGSKRTGHRAHPPHTGPAEAPRRAERESGWSRPVAEGTPRLRKRRPLPQGSAQQQRTPQHHRSLKKTGNQRAMAREGDSLASRQLPSPANQGAHARQPWPLRRRAPKNGRPRPDRAMPGHQGVGTKGQASATRATRPARVSAQPPRAAAGPGTINAANPPPAGAPHHLTLPKRAPLAAGGPLKPSDAQAGDQGPTAHPPASRPSGG